MRDKNEIKRMGKRRFIKILSGLGASAITLSHVSQDAVAEQLGGIQKDRIPYVERLVETPDSNGRKPILAEVSKERWKHTVAAHQAAKKLDSKINEENVSVGVQQISNGSPEKEIVIKAIETVGERFHHSSEISKSELREVESLTPGKVSQTVARGNQKYKVENIPVTVRKVTKVLDDSFKDKYTPVPGGCYISYDNSDGNRSTIVKATSGTKASSTHNGRDLMLGCAHFVNLADPYGDVYYQQKNDPGHEFTTPLKVDYKYGNGLDVAKMEPVSSRSLTNGIASDGGGTTDYPVTGIITWDTITYREGTESYELTKQGVTTGRNSGFIFNTTPSPNQFELRVTGKGGDSGGPIYKEFDSNPNLGTQDHTAIAGINAYHYDIDGTRYSGGNHIGVAENELDVQVP